MNVEELLERENMKRQRGDATLTVMIVLCVLGVVVVTVFLFLVFPVFYNVWASEKSGQAALAKADQSRQILVTQARAEKEAAGLRAEAIKIIGEAAKMYPEYRQQEFIGAFAEALQNSKVNQIIYVPTEANIPIIERKH